MKKLLTLLNALVILCLLYSCSEEEPMVQKEQVQFLLNVPASDNSGRTASDLPEGVKLLISVANSSGSVLTLHPVTILKLGDSYITEPLELPVGRYSVTDFLVANTTEVLFATPKHGSPLAGAVV